MRTVGVGRGAWGVVRTAARHARRPTPYALLAGLLAASATPVAAQTVLLELRPAPGDTIRMRVDQETEVLGQRKGAGAPPGHRMAMTVRLWSRAVVEGRLPGATSILSITDSVRLTTTDRHARELASRTARALTGRAMRLRLATDGTARVLGRDDDRDLAAVVSAMPAAFPARPVAVGEHWRREMPVPAAPPTASDEGVIRAVFRLDSLTRGGALAWISVKGEMSGEPRAAADGQGAGDAMTGSLSGALVLDRRRGWLDDARFSLVVRTTVLAPGTPAIPMQVTTTIEQRMRAEAPTRGRRAAGP